MGSAIGAVASIAGAGSSIFSSREASKDAKTQGKINEALAKADAAVAKIFTDDQIKQRQESLNQEISTAGARFAAGGVDVGAGSPLLAQADILRVGLEDIESLVINGQLDVYRAELGGKFSRQEASATAAAARAQGVSAVATGINQLAQNPFVINKFSTTPIEQGAT